MTGSAAVPLAMAGGGEAGRPYDLVVFGASGFTGQFVVEEVARAAAGGELRSALRWAVAGRSKEKLRAVLERAAERLGTGRGGGVVWRSALVRGRRGPRGPRVPTGTVGSRRRAGVRGRAEGRSGEAAAARPAEGSEAPVGAAGGVGDGGLRCAGKAALGAEVGLLLCDVGDAASLAAMARQTRLVLNCVGPVSAGVRAVLPRRPAGAAPGRARGGACLFAPAAGLSAVGLPAPRAGRAAAALGKPAAGLRSAGSRPGAMRLCGREAEVQPCAGIVGRFPTTISAGGVHGQFLLKYSRI